MHNITMPEGRTHLAPVQCFSVTALNYFFHPLDFSFEGIAFFNLFIDLLKLGIVCIFVSFNTLIVFSRFSIFDIDLATALAMTEAWPEQFEQ